MSESILWQTVRIPVLAVLRLAEPLVRLLLGGLGLLSLLTAGFFKAVSHLPTHSLVVLVSFGVTCGIVLVLYERTVTLLSR